MKVFPTLQIENGLTVPFFGEAPTETAPMEMVEQLLDLGCTHVTFIDRDAASGRGNNRDLILKLTQRFVRGAGKACIQVGGGIRSSDQAQMYLDHGVTWILVNAIIQRSPLMTEQLVARFQTRLTATLAAYRGQFQEPGRNTNLETTLEQAAQYIKDLGIRRALYIDLPGPGVIEPDWQSARRITEITRIPLLMSGTVATEEHVRQASAIPGVHGVLLDAWTVTGNPRLLPHSTEPCA
ncbi:MAG: 1-(5-phosphoribosyl)-5-[(5-phosphoribosylamino)methylideneamino] imidazole-4-carboxamide isomerase [Holophagaceae bacterium]|nr:1-(5-phosphoribosyl)-5-[(5-phosphoribosylamino)methylideneamino] imidazole-4-carboxamide isomerase [Holophagaceae bacterium]